MKQKINLRLIGISVLAVLATLICITYVYYGLFQEQIRRDLETEAMLIAEAGISGLIENEVIIAENEIRITWISPDGKVLFDNDVLADNMENHMDRPEVADAFAKGYGESTRKSSTMDLRNFYYAVVLKDGTVLRVAKEARSMFSVFKSIFLVVFLILVIIIALCIVISHYLTQQLLSPIGEMAENMERVPETTTYKELTPFLDRIREQHEDILAAARNRQEFTANVSHELKTPITAISGYAELIENQMVDETTQIKFAGAIRKNADRLVSLVNDIIRLSELDQSSTKPDFTKVDLYEIAEERVELLQSNARKKNLALMLHGSSCEIMSNRGMLVELLDNIIQNAIRYNIQNGKVIVTVKKDGNKGILIVEDTGIGIPEEDQKRVFERFYRVDKSRSRETGGTGLGLAIVKHIVELHEGTVEIQSELGKGTIVKIEL